MGQEEGEILYGGVWEGAVLERPSGEVAMCRTWGASLGGRIETEAAVESPPCSAGGD